MLVLSRKKNESIVIDGPCKVTVVEVRGDKVRLGIQAERSVTVHREEIWLKINAAALVGEPSVVSEEAA